MEAERFLRALGGSFTFQTFNDAKLPTQKRDPLAKWMHGSLAECAYKLADLNARGAGVFVMVNEGNGKGRKIANVKRVRAYFADFDDVKPPAVESAPMTPHAIIESSPGRWHWYWFIEGAPLDEFKTVQRPIAGRFGSDPSVCDLPRVMRLPGYLHHKREPFLTRIVELRDAPRYTHADFLLAFGIDLSVSAPQSATSGPTRAASAKVTRLHTLQPRKRVLPDAIPEGKRNATLLSLAAGLVRKGHELQGVTDRMQKINAERCDPPLCATEVDTIAKQAVGYGSSGFTILPDKLLDSPEWKALPPPAHDIVVTAFRRYDGSNNGNIALTWADFDGKLGFGKKGTFYRHRRKAIASGILQTREGCNTQRGKTADLFTIAPQWIPSPVPKREPGASTQKVHPYINKQAYGAESFQGTRAQTRKREQHDETAKLR